MNFRQKQDNSSYQVIAVTHSIISRNALSRAHTYAKAADPANFFPLHKR